MPGNSHHARRIGLDALTETMAGRYRTPLRGRQPEAAALQSGFERAEEGRLAVTLLRGDAGIGKTRLVQQALEHAEGHGWSTVTVTPDVDSAMSPLGALLEASERTEPPLILEADLRTLMSGHAPHYWLTRLLSDGLEAASTTAGVLFVVDDLQWLDPGSFGVLTALLRDLHGLPIYWVFTTREGTYSPSHGRFIKLLTGLGAVLDLKPLDDAAVAAMAQDILGRPTGPIIESTMRRTAGHPLVVVELLHGLDEEGLLHEHRGVLDLEDEALPARFGSSARERLSALTSGAVRIAQIGSLYGREFPVTDVLDIIGRSATDAAPDIQELLDLGFIVDTGESLAFRHDTIQSAALDSLPPTLRRAMAREVLQRRLHAGERPASLASTIASVAEEGDDYSIELLVLASNQLARTDMEGALELAMLGARLAGGHPRHAERVATLAPILLAGGPASEGVEVSRSLLTMLDAESQVRVRLAMARRFTETDFDSAIAEANAGLSTPGISDASRVQLLAVRALNHANIADPVGLRENVDLARAVADPQRDAPALATIDATESVLLFYQDRFAEADALQRRAMDRLHKAGSAPELWLPEGLWLAFMRNSLGHGDEALELTDAGVREARTAKNITAEAYWLMVRARTMYDLGRLGEARMISETVLGIAETLELGDFANATAGIVLHRIALHTGDVRLREQSRPLVEALAAGRALTRTGRWSLALEALDNGRLTEARSLAQLAVETLSEPSPSMTTPADFADDIRLALICRGVDDDRSLELLAQIAHQRATANPTNTLVQSVARAVQGIRDESVKDLHAAVELLRGVGRPLVLALLLDVIGQIDGADTTSSRAALHLYDEIGALRDATRVLRRLRSRGVRTRLKASSADDQSGLSQREYQVAERISLGLTTQQIADELLLSPHTVVAHIRHIYAKWNVNTRREVAEILRDSKPPTPAS